MKENDDASTPNSSSYDIIKNTLTTNAIFCATKSTATLFTQPIHVVMRNQQAQLANKENPKFLSAAQAAKAIGYPNGKSFSITPFYRGFAPGLAKEMLKNGVYKGALITGAPSLADKILVPIRLADIAPPTHYHVIQSTVAGVVAATADVAIGGALESWATQAATSHGKDAQSHYWKEVQNQKSMTAKIARMYRGAGAATLKGMTSFVPYFMVDKPMKRQFAKMYDVQDARQMPLHGKLLSALATGGVVALASSPFDIIKTQAQMPNPSNHSIFTALKTNFKLHGLKGITAGLPLKFTMIAIGWGIYDVSSQIVEELNHSRKLGR